MKYNFLDSIDNLKNCKLVKRNKWVIVAGGLALSSLLTGCSDDVQINDKYTVIDVINSYKDKTTLDDNLALLKVAPDEDSKPISWKTANELYLKARNENNIEECNKYLYVMNKMLLECKLLEALDYNLKDFSDVSFSVDRDDETAIYVASLEYNVKEEKSIPGGLSESVGVNNVETFIMDGIAADVAINLARAHKGRLNFSEGTIDLNINIDDCYRKLTSFAAGTSEIRSNVLGIRSFIVDTPSKKRIKSLKLD